MSRWGAPIAQQPESFADAPQSIGELKAHKERNSRYWTPRDVLVDMLRQIDAKEIAPTMLLVSWRDDNEVNFSCSNKDKATHAVGLLETTKFLLLKDAYGA